MRAQSPLRTYFQVPTLEQALNTRPTLKRNVLEFLEPKPELVLCCDAHAPPPGQPESGKCRDWSMDIQQSITSRQQKFLIACASNIAYRHATSGFHIVVWLDM